MSKQHFSLIFENNSNTIVTEQESHTKFVTIICPFNYFGLSFFNNFMTLFLTDQIQLQIDFSFKWYNFTRNQRWMFLYFLFKWGNRILYYYFFLFYL